MKRSLMFYIWAVFTLFVAVAVTVSAFTGRFAYWHIPTVLVSYLMAALEYSDPSVMSGEMEDGDEL